MQEKPLKRIFIAVNLPGKVKDEIYEKAGRVIDGNSGKDGLKIVGKENLHITLKFVEYVDEEELRGIIENAEKINFQGFEIVLGDAGTFGQRVLWIGLSEGEGKLLELATEVQKVTEKGDDRFSPHVTIARNKSMPANKVREIVEKINSKQIDIRMKVESFEVMESMLGRKGPEYRVVFSRKLI